MKNTILLFLAFFMIAATLQEKHKPCGTYKGKNIYKGKEGGCYYLKGKQHDKIYIDKKHCKCK
jgi:hypothetical protein